MRGMLQVLKKYCHHKAEVDMFLAMDFSGNASSELQNHQVQKTLFPAVEKTIAQAHNWPRFGLVVTGALELVFPMQSLYSDDDTKQHLLAKWMAMCGSVGHLSSMAIALDIVGVGRVIAVKKISFQNRTDLQSLILGNWTERLEDELITHQLTAEPSAEDFVQTSHVSSEDVTEESYYDKFQDDDDDDQSWKSDGSDDWVNHSSVQESWDGLSDLDSVTSLDDVYLFSYADMLRYGRKADLSAKATQDAIHHLYVPEMGTKTTNTKPLPSIMEDSVSLIVSDHDLRQKFLSLHESINLMLDQEKEPADLIDAFDAKYERRGRKGGTRSDGKTRWKRYK
jgi:hypothetical protein